MGSVFPEQEAIRWCVFVCVCEWMCVIIFCWHYCCLRFMAHVWINTAEEPQFACGVIFSWFCLNWRASPGNINTCGSFLFLKIFSYLDLTWILSVNEGGALHTSRMFWRRWFLETDGATFYSHYWTIWNIFSLQTSLKDRSHTWTLSSPHPELTTERGRL